MNYIINTQGKVIFSAEKTGYFHKGQGLCAVQINGKWGFINTRAEIAIPCIYEQVWPFDEETFGTAIVKSNGKYGLINKQGEKIIPCQYSSYENVPKPHDGIICIENLVGEKRIYKCIDTNGNHLFTMEALVPIEFSEGLARVWISYDKGHGVIDKRGNFVIAPGIYDFVSDFHFGVAIAEKNGKHGYINKNGEIIVGIKYDSIRDNDSNPIACVFIGKKFGYIDKRNGKEIIPITLEGDDRNIRVAYSEMMGVIQLDSIIYIYNTEDCRLYKSTKYNSINLYCSGLCAIEQSGKIGFIDKHCKLVIPCKFESTRSCYSYYFLGETCAMEHCIIDRQGRVIRSFSNDWVPETITSGHEDKKYLYHIYNKRNGAEATLFNLKGEPIISGMEFYRTLPNVFPVAIRSKTNGKWGFVDQNGVMVVPCQFEESYSFEDGFATIDEPIRMSGYRGTSNTYSSFTSKTISKSGCYVATAVYGSYNCPQVWTLRRFRDNTLDESWYGRAFIKTYYAISPTLVKWFGETSWFKILWRKPLDKLVTILRNKGVEDTPYNDKY